jgi:hypothetical protein
METRARHGNHGGAVMMKKATGILSALSALGGGLPPIVAGSHVRPSQAERVRYFGAEFVYDIDRQCRVLAKAKRARRGVRVLHENVLPVVETA